MANVIESLINDRDALLALEPEELGSVLLEVLSSIAPNMRSRGNFTNMISNSYLWDVPDNFRTDALRAFSEAWSWLEAEGLIAPEPKNNQGFSFITRRGHRALATGTVKTYLSGQLLPKNQVHPRLAQKVTGAFLRGEYDVAVFQAFKEVEISVRDAGGFPAEKVGVDLMRDAFGKRGPLRDASLPAAEEESLAHLFAGAIGYCRNSTGHRDVVMEAVESVELILFASFLLRIVDARKSPSKK